MSFWEQVSNNPMFIPLVITLIWAVRLEAKILYLEKDFGEQKKNVWAKIDSIGTSLSEISSSIAWIKGKMETADS